MNLIERALALREGGQTQRCHTLQYSGPYNVAIHSYNALSLLLLLYPGTPRLALIKAVQWHDTPERWTGDIPTPVKMESPLLRTVLENLEEKVLSAIGIKNLFKNLTLGEKKWLNAVDLLELHMWEREQAAMGNSSVATMHTQILKIFEEKKNTIPKEVWDFYENFEWKRIAECHELIGEMNEQGK